MEAFHTKPLIALFRSLNVGGKNLLPMKNLEQLLKDLGLLNVRTYIQSGNAIFQSTEKNAPLLSRKIEAAVLESHGFTTRLIMFKLRNLVDTIESNPFPDAVPKQNRLHLTFLASVPINPDLKSLKRLKRKNKQFALEDKVFYLHAPDGIGRSKLAGRVEKCLGVLGTSRLAYGHQNQRIYREI